VCDPCERSSRTLVSLRELKCPYCGRKYRDDQRAPATRKGREQAVRDHPELRERGVRSVREFEQEEIEGFRELEAGEQKETAGVVPVEAAESPPEETADGRRAAAYLEARVARRHETADVRAARETTDAAVSWPDPHPLVDEADLLEQAIAATERALRDRRRLERIAAGYPEFVGRRGALLSAIAALAWERGQPLHLRTQPADVARLGRLLELALRGASVSRVLEKGEG
jgi:hypothetical protein